MVLVVGLSRGVESEVSSAAARLMDGRAERYERKRSEASSPACRLLQKPELSLAR